MSDDEKKTLTELVAQVDKANAELREYMSLPPESGCCDELNKVRKELKLVHASHNELRYDFQQLENRHAEAVLTGKDMREEIAEGIHDRLELVEGKSSAGVFVMVVLLVCQVAALSFYLTGVI